MNAEETPPQASKSRLNTALKPSAAPEPGAALKPGAAWNWLTRYLHSIPTASGRRQRLLAWLLLSLLILTLATLLLVLIVNSPASPRRSEYIVLILGLDILIMAAYGLNCAGRYTAAARLTVIGAVFGPWGSLLFDPAILRGDFVPLAYVIVSVLLSSILLSPLATALLAGAQVAALALLPVFSPATAIINWPSFLTLIFFTSVLSILSNMISQSDLAQIERQADLLAQNEARLLELSVRDHLTRLFNRRYLEETLEREIQRSRRSQASIGVILFDADDFKQVNDRWGHAAGDVVLQQLARTAAAQIRAGDIACRYGGDEFVLVLPEASFTVTQERARQLGQAVRHLEVEYEGHSMGALSISVGVAVYPEQGATTEELLKSADHDLYRAKRDRLGACDERR